MKKLFATLILLTFVLGANAQNAAPAQPQTSSAKDNKNGPKFKFKEDAYDFGKVKEGPIAKHVFEFKNVGKEPLIIQSATAGCSCTVSEWPKEPILPGKSSKIVVKFNTQNRVGPFSKDVYLQSNAVTEKERYELHISGTVEAAATAAVPAK